MSELDIDVLEKLGKLTRVIRKEGIEPTLINMHTVKPLDEKTVLKYAKKTGAIVTCEEHQIAGGLGGAVSECLSGVYPVPFEFVGVRDSFGESGRGYELRDKYGISTKEIIKAVKKVMKIKI